jgi:hypothetical protein
MDYPRTKPQRRCARCHQPTTGYRCPACRLKEATRPCQVAWAKADARYDARKDKR